MEDGFTLIEKVTSRGGSCVSADTEGGPQRAGSHEGEVRGEFKGHRPGGMTGWEAGERARRAPNAHT